MTLALLASLRHPGFASLASTPWRVSTRINSYSLRIATLLVLIALLNFTDLVYTLFAHRAGMLNEMNPIAANLFSMDLEPSVICFKTLSVLVGCFMLWRLRRSPWVPMACWLLIFIYAALAIRWFLWSQNFVHLMELEAANSVPSLRIHHV